MKTKIQLTIILCFCWFAGFSQIIDANTAYQKAVEFFEFKTNYEKSVTTHSYRINHIIENDTTFIYVVDIDNVGWALVSAVDNAGPYFAYSMHSTIDMNDMPPAAELWIDYYKNIARHCMHNPQDMRFYQEEFMTKINQKSMSQGSFYMIQTKWHQGPPFNNYVDKDTENYCSSYYDNRCPAGCVAIAMAQIMRYWVHPLKKYDWCVMDTLITVYSDNFAQNAVATLVSDIGYATNMSYCFFNTCNSFAWPSDAKNAFKNTFKYSNEIEAKERRWHSINKWKTLLKDELDLFRPIFYSGCKSYIPESCHAFIIDGYDYDDNNKFHFNFGWSNTAWNAFYDFFDEDVPEIIDYKKYQKAVINIFPKTTPTCDTQHIIKEYFRYDSDNEEKYWNPVDGTIKTALPPNNVVIKSGETVSYRAFNDIDLREGLTVEHGANFTASIVPCPLDCKFDPMYIRMQDKQTLALIMTDEVDSFNNPSETNTKTDIDLNTDIIIYPNPFSKKLTIQDTNKNILLVEIINIEGKIVYRRNHFEETLNLGFLETGLYLLKLHTLNDIIITKIIKQ